MTTLPKQRPFMTIQQTIEAYQDSELCRSTREAKRNGAWYKKDYTAGQETDISKVGENYVFEERKLRGLLYGELGGSPLSVREVRTLAGNDELLKTFNNKSQVVMFDQKEAQEYNVDSY